MTEEKNIEQEAVTPVSAPPVQQEKQATEQQTVSPEGGAAVPEQKKGRKRRSSGRRKPAGRSGDSPKKVDVKSGEEQKKPAPKDGKVPKDDKSAREEEEAGPTVVKLLINSEEPEECRIAQIEDGRLQSFHVTTVVREQTRNNIYKGRITAVEANLQAAFVDIGGDKNGFLPFAEIHPEYYAVDTDKHWKDLNIQEVVKKGQEVLVQVVKEATGNKGANMTTYLSLPGRLLVLMPGSDSAGISRKIEDEAQRTQLREMMNSLKVPEGIGYIIRTASKEITKTAISKDLRYLLRLWTEIKKRGQTMAAPALIYEDQDIIAKFMRDHFTPEIQEIKVDTQDTYDQVKNFLELLPARQRKTKAVLHQGSRPLFNYYDLEEQIEQIYQPQVGLPSGGSIVINPTEALVAIDVNSGRTSKDKNFAETIYLVNKEAAVELTRQLRLRDLGGLIVVDFIDMRNARHIREVEKLVKNSMKRDKAKVDISRISKFGLMQISRQKLGSPVQMGSYKVCDHCQGRGVVRTVETQALMYLRRIQTGAIQKKVRVVEARLPMAVAQYLLNNKRQELLELETQYEVTIRVEPVPEMKPEEHKIDLIRE